MNFVQPLTEKTSPCPKCGYYLYGWRSRGPDFPFVDWDIVERRDIQVGTHASVDVFEGKARCKACGYISDFYCTYGDGYGFTPQLGI